MHVAEQLEPANVVVNGIVVLGPVFELVPDLVDRTADRPLGLDADRLPELGAVDAIAPRRPDLLDLQIEANPLLLLQHMANLISQVEHAVVLTQHVEDLIMNLVARGLDGRDVGFDGIVDVQHRPPHPPAGMDDEPSIGEGVFRERIDDQVVTHSA